MDLRWGAAPDRAVFTRFRNRDDRSRARCWYREVAMGYYRQGPGRPYGSGVSFGVPPLTPVVRGLLIACVGVWVVQLALHLAGQVWPSAVLGVVPSAFVSGWIWQPVTYMFLHSPAAIGHILMNMLILWMIGGDLERHWGGAAFLRYYLLCGVGAGLMVVTLGLLAGPPATLVPTIGASGAIYGLILAYGTIFADRVLLFMLMFPMRARTFAILLFVIAFVSSLGPGATGVSHIAHLGGMIVGWVVLHRAWRVGTLWRDLRWRLARRRFRVVSKNDRDPWVH